MLSVQTVSAALHCGQPLRFGCKCLPSLVRRWVPGTGGLASADVTRKPLLELIPLLPRFLFPCGLMTIVISVLAAGVGVVAGVNAFLLRRTPVAGRP